MGRAMVEMTAELDAEGKVWGGGWCGCGDGGSGDVVSAEVQS